MKDARFFVKNMEVIDEEYILVMGMQSQQHLSTQDEDLTCQCQLMIYQVSGVECSLSFKQEIGLSELNESRVDELPYQSHLFSVLPLGIRDVFIIYTNQSHSLVFIHRE